MTKIRVKISYELEIPDDWRVVSPNEDQTPHLVINGRFYQPDMTWMVYEGRDVEGIDTWVEADGEVLEMIGDHIRFGTECSIRKIKRFAMEREE